MPQETFTSTGTFDPSGKTNIAFSIRGCSGSGSGAAENAGGGGGAGVVVGVIPDADVAEVGVHLAVTIAEADSGAPTSIIVVEGPNEGTGVIVNGATSGDEGSGGIGGQMSTDDLNWTTGAFAGGDGDTGDLGDDEEAGGGGGGGATASANGTNASSRIGGSVGGGNGGAINASGANGINGGGGGGAGDNLGGNPSAGLGCDGVVVFTYDLLVNSDHRSLVRPIVLSMTDLRNSLAEE